MKKSLIILLLSFCSLVNAQTFSNFNTLSRIAIVYYEKDGKGFFHKRENVTLVEVKGVNRIYGFNKKSNELYMETNNANCVVVANEQLAKHYKKSKTVPILKEKELEIASDQVSRELEDKFARLNESRQKAINDSIEKARLDSIKLVKEDSIRKENEKRREISYRKNHNWKMVPTKCNYLYCVFCEKNVETRDSSVCFAIKNDSIFWGEYMNGDLDIGYIHIHAAKVSTNLQRDASFRYHYNVYSDSLEQAIPFMCTSIAGYKNYINYGEYLEELRKKAPNGYFLYWGWDKEYSSISFNFKYLNTNKKTIKYIDVYWVLKNDVGDVRKSGKFSGTGPLGEWESASWNWDSSSYYVSGDASKMSLSKVFITYMDGSKVTIPYSKIYVN